MSWMIYGANGYTGRLAAIESVRRGMRPVLGGRNEAAIAQLAKSWGWNSGYSALMTRTRYVKLSMA